MKNDKIITSRDIQRKYIKFYEFLREYTLNYPTVEALADLEVAVYDRFPDKGKLISYLTKLKGLISSIYSSDADVKKSFDKLEGEIDSYESVYCKLDKPDIIESKGE